MNCKTRSDNSIVFDATLLKYPQLYIVYCIANTESECVFVFK